MELLESQTTILSDRRLGSFKLSSKVDGGGRKGARADDDISKTILHTEGVSFFTFSLNGIIKCNRTLHFNARRQQFRLFT